ncbi:MAG: Uncharacterized protein G01um101416_757 [Microgenomates group bacterium Gr01-1014_16]|nr:MAG: Uncharacterized protein G01um101416_757 [Microgenomates group bacterium Gr01-1014_16]
MIKFSLVVILLAVFLRFWNLNALPIFADESIYVRWSQVMRAEPSLRFLPLSDGKQPLFMWATIPFFKVISDPLVAARALSALAGLGTIAGIALAAHLLFNNRRITLLAGLLSSVMPYLVFFDRLALADSLLSLFVIWTFIFSYLSIVHRRLDMAMLAGFTLGFAWLTKSPALFALVLLPTLFIFSNRKNIFVACGLWLVTCAIAIAIYNILRLGPEFHMVAIRNKDYVYSFAEVLRHPLDPLVPHLKDSLNFNFYLLTPAGLLFAIWGLIDGHRTHLRQRLILASFFLIPIFIQSAIAKAFTARYLLFTVPFAVISIAHAIEHISQKSQKHLLVYATSALIILPSLWVDSKLLTRPADAPLPRIERSGYLEEWTAGQGLREVSDYLRRAALSGPVLVGSEGFFGTPFSALQLYLNDIPNVRVVGVGVWIDSVHEKLKNSLADNQVFLVVNSSRFHVNDPAKIDLDLIASYPKALRPDGTREYLLFFKVR